MFPWFFMCLEALCCFVFSFQEGVTFRSLYWLASGENYLLSALPGILKLSQTFHGYACFTLLVFSWGKILNCLPSLSLAKPDWVLTTFCLLSIGWCWMLKFVYFLPIPQIQASFLQAFSSYLQRFTLSALGGVHRKPATVCVGEVCRALGVPIGQLGDPQVWCPQWFVSRLPDGVCFPSMPSESHGCPTSPCHEAHFSILEAWEKCGRVCPCSTELGKLGAHSLSLFPEREITGQKGLSWHFLWLLGGGGRCGNAGKAEVFLLSSSEHPTSDFFFFLQWCAGTSLWDSQTSPKTPLSMGDCQNWRSLEGRW